MLSRGILLTIYSMIFILIIVLILLITQLNNAMKDVYESQLQQQRSHILADELRQSSDDLTRMARTYAVTGNPKYEEMYWRILAIRNGEEARPEHYEFIYWDFISAGVKVDNPKGEKIPLRQRMKNVGFTNEELEKLTEAQRHSDDLVFTELIVMNAVKGRFLDEHGNFTLEGGPDLALARKYMFDDKYHQEKAKIMKPINEFLLLTHERTDGAVKQNLQKAQQLVNYISLVSIILLVLTLVMVISFIKRKRLHASDK